MQPYSFSFKMKCNCNITTANPVWKKYQILKNRSYALKQKHSAAHLHCSCLVNLLHMFIYLPIISGYYT